MYLASSFSPSLQAEELINPLITFLVAEIDGLTVGYAKLISGSVPECVTGRKAIELSRIYVMQEWIGKGVGGER